MNREMHDSFLCVTNPKNAWAGTLYRLVPAEKEALLRHVTEHGAELGSGGSRLRGQSVDQAGQPSQ